MLRVNAVSNTTQMIQGQTIRNRAIEYLPQDAMYPPAAMLGHLDHSVALTVLASLPKPAGFGL